MSGKIELKIRKGKSLDNRYEYYPEWYLEITDEQTNKKVVLSPSWKDLEKFMEDILIHELRVDRIRDRNPDSKKWINFVKKMVKLIDDDGQVSLRAFVNIPEIYFAPRRKYYGSKQDL